MCRTRWLVILAGCGLGLGVCVVSTSAQQRYCPWAMQFQKFNFQQQSTQYYQQQMMQQRRMLLQRQQQQQQMLQRQRQMMMTRRTTQTMRPPLLQRPRITPPTMRTARPTTRTLLNTRTMMMPRSPLLTGTRPATRPLQPRRVVPSNLLTPRLSRPSLMRPGNLIRPRVVQRPPQRTMMNVRLQRPPLRLAQPRVRTNLRPQIQQRPVVNRPVNVVRNVPRYTVGLNMTCNRCHDCRNQNRMPLVMAPRMSNPLVLPPRLTNPVALMPPRVANPLIRPPALALLRPMPGVQPPLPVVVPKPRVALLVPLVPPKPELERAVAAAKPRSTLTPLLKQRPELDLANPYAPSDKASAMHLLRPVSAVEPKPAPSTHTRVSLDHLLYPWVPATKDSAPLVDVPTPTAVFAREPAPVAETDWPELPPLRSGSLIVPPPRGGLDLWTDPDAVESPPAAPVRTTGQRQPAAPDPVFPPLPPSNSPFLLPR